MKAGNCMSLDGKSGMREHKRYPHIPLWLGKESLKDKTILIYAEQGYGNTIMDQMNLIDSIDTTTAHMGGALNIPTLLLILDPPDFMALTDEFESPWYLMITIIRQEKRGIWLVNNIALSIKRLAIHCICQQRFTRYAITRNQAPNI